MIHVPELDLSTGEKGYQECQWCELGDALDALQEKNYHDPRCPETCRNKEVGRAAWLRGKADAKMHQYHGGESYNGQYELGHELGSFMMFWNKYMRENTKLEERFPENMTKGNIVI